MADFSRAARSETRQFAEARRRHRRKGIYPPFCIPRRPHYTLAEDLEETDMPIAALLLGLLVVASTPSAQGSKSVSAKSETCREAVGKTQRDLDNALAFCKQSVPKDLNLQGVIAMESLLWVKITRSLANVMMADKLTTEQVVKNWMSAWKKHSGSKAVTVYVEWGDVEIAKGDTTIFSGDKVTIK